MIRMPWEFSKPAVAGAGAVENLPSEEGAALGRELARLCDNAEAEVRQRHPRPRCADCAFRLGTRPNQCAETVMDALKAVMEGVPFYCHLGVEDGEAERLCAGWAIAIGDGSRTDTD